MTTATLSDTALAFSVDARPFVSAVSWVARRVPGKLRHPALGGMVMEVSDGRLTVSAFDYDAMHRADLELDRGTDGRVLVSGRLLAKLAETFPDKPVSVALDGSQVTVACGSLKLTLPTMPIEDYPTLPLVPPPIGSVEAEPFATVLKRVVVAADRDGSASVAGLTGVYLKFTAGSIQVMGIDRYRGAVGSIGWQGSVDDAGVLVPSLVVVELARVLASAGGTVEIGLEPDRLASFTGPGRSVVVRPLAEQFPVAMPSAFPSRSDTPVAVDVAELSTALKRAAIAREPKTPALLEFEPGSVTVQASGSTGGISDVVACSHDGEPVTVRINPQLLLDGLDAMHSDVAELHLGAPARALMLTPAGDGDYRHLIQTIRQT